MRISTRPLRRRFVGSFDEFAILEFGSGADKGTGWGAMTRMDSADASLGGAVVRPSAMLDGHSTSS